MTKRLIRKAASLIKGKFPLLFALLKMASKLFPPLYNYINGKLVEPPKRWEPNFCLINPVCREIIDLPFPGEVKTNVIICFAARSGSTLLCNLMENTNQMGRPAEFFNKNIKAQFMHRVGAKNINEYIERLQNCRTSPSGIFSLKIEHAQYKDSFENERLEKYFDNIKYIRIKRRDLLAQAVSLSKANVTGEWVSVYKDIDPIYVAKMNEEITESLIEISYRHLVNVYRRWDKYFNKADRKVLDIYYEDFMFNYDFFYEKIFDYLKIEKPIGFHVKEADIQRQSDEVNEHWIEKMRPKVEEMNASLGVSG